MIHPTVWPQYTNVTDRRTDRTNNGCQKAILLPLLGIFLHSSPHKASLSSRQGATVYTVRTLFFSENVRTVRVYVILPYVDLISDKLIHWYESLTAVAMLDWNAQTPCSAVAPSSTPVGFQWCELLLHFAWVVDDAKCIVVTRVCVCRSVRGRMPTRTTDKTSGVVCIRI